MKLNFAVLRPSRNAPAKAKTAFTLPELLISVGLFSLVVISVVGANLFGLRMFQITENKLSASDGARKAMGKMTDEIRNCKSTWVGNVSSNGVFVGHLNGELQTGNGLQICRTTNSSTNFIIYFINPADQSLRRTTSAGNTTILARSLTNSVVFRAQDCLGNVLTNNQNNRVIHVDLEFLQPARYGVVADYFKLETAVTRR
jgi:hypothetical protein